jgi:hypothetical protein
MTMNTFITMLGFFLAIILIMPMGISIPEKEKLSSVTSKDLLIRGVAWIISKVVKPQYSNSSVLSRKETDVAKIKIYKFTRTNAKLGKTYSCHVSIVDNGHIVFSDINVPVGTPNDVVIRLMDNAETEVLKTYNKEIADGG